MAFGTIMVAFGTTNIGLRAKVGQKKMLVREHPRIPFGK